MERSEIQGRPVVRSRVALRSPGLQDCSWL